VHQDYLISARETKLKTEDYISVETLQIVTLDQFALVAVIHLSAVAEAVPAKPATIASVQVRTTRKEEQQGQKMGMSSK
jgi:hypothetical protein